MVLLFCSGDDGLCHGCELVVVVCAVVVGVVVVVIAMVLAVIFLVMAVVVESLFVLFVVLMTVVWWLFCATAPFRVVVAKCRNPPPKKKTLLPFRHDTPPTRQYFDIPISGKQAHSYYTYMI